ncbi:uncharacterized protein LOC143375948 [Andrena cerasifolii]|uniref:uncharacterized protein LOC143375948 n=1 Tax=Andrena cerasifolii TaxID=2819439 RepID=UPI004037D065
MAKIVSLSAVILGCISLARGDPPVTTAYSITGDNNGYEFNSNVINGAYMAGKEGHRESTDFYAAGNSGHSLASGRSQGNLEESLRSSSYSGFSPSSHNGGFQAYAGSTRESLAASPYFMNDAAQSSFEGFTSSNSNGDSGFEGFAHGADQAGSEFSQFSNSKPKSSGYMRYADNLPGASSAGSFSDLAPEGSFREFSGDIFKGHVSDAYMEGDQAFSREPSSLFNSPGSDYPYRKHKEAAFAAGGSNKYTPDVYSVHPDTRYVRGNHGNLGRDYASPVYLPSSASSHLSSIRGGSGPYASGKFSKYNKYLGDYTSNGGLNYVSKDQDVDYALGNYGKGGKVVALKDSRPSSSYGSQAYQTYLGGPSYLNKMSASHKSKPSYVSYPSSSAMGYPPMSSLHSSYSGNSYSGNSYADGPMLRRYRSSSGYIPSHSSMYSGYY